MSDARAIWSIAVPAMASNVATALIGVADVWVIGQLGDAPAQGAVELGARLLMTLLVVFNFLRTATTGLAAQAAGRGDDDALAAELLRPLGFALVIGAVLLLLQRPLIASGLDILGADGAVRTHAATYVGIRYWAAPFWLLNAALTGWLIGTRRVGAALAVEIAINLVHVALDLLFVLGLGWGVAGVAAATLSSEVIKFALLVAVVAAAVPVAVLLTAARRGDVWRRDALARLLGVNRDLFLRTLLLMAAFVLITRVGAEQGATVLAANAILLQLFMLSALLLDAFENAAQVLCGEAVGARDRDRFSRVARAILMRGVAVAALLSLLILLAAPVVVASFSTDPGVVDAALRYLGWAAVLPLAGVVSFVFDGIFVGAAWTRAMLVSMALALVVYIAVLAVGPPGNDGLWLGFAVFLACRAFGQAALLPSLVRRSFAPIVSA